VTYLYLYSFGDLDKKNIHKDWTIWLTIKRKSHFQLQLLDEKNMDEFFSLNEIWQWWIIIFFVDSGWRNFKFYKFYVIYCLFHDNHYGTKKKKKLKRRLWRKVVIGVLINLSYNFARKKNAPQCLMNNCSCVMFFSLQNWNQQNK
jgi:hypothetical protein